MHGSPIYTADIMPESIATAIFVFNYQGRIGNRFESMAGVFLNRLEGLIKTIPVDFYPANASFPAHQEE